MVQQRRCSLTVLAAAALACGPAGAFVATGGLIMQPTRGLIRARRCGVASEPPVRPRACGLSMETEYDTKKVTKEAEERMKKSLESIKSNMNTLRTGRANPSVLDRIVADYYGMETPINKMATIKTTSATQLTLEPYDKAGLVAIERAILESGVGLTPSNDGSVIRLNIPPVTEDRRKELCKEARSIGEEGKVALRNIRRDAVDGFKKAEKKKTLSQDASKNAQDAIQKLTDKYVKEADAVVAAKEKDIMKV